MNAPNNRETHDIERRLEILEHKTDELTSKLVTLETLSLERNMKIDRTYEKQELISHDIASIKAELSTKTSFVGGVIFAITAIWVLGKVIFDYIMSGKLSN